MSPQKPLTIQGDLQNHSTRSDLLAGLRVSYGVFTARAHHSEVPLLLEHDPRHVLRGHVVYHHNHVS